MKLLIGLGNPGDKYARNRHNVGFMAVDAIARAYNFGPWRRRFQAETAEGRIGDEQCLLIKPMTFMNESGRAVGEAMRFYKLAPWDLIVFHDEIDLPPGKMRVKVGGSHAGHNGLRSLDAHVGPQYCRVRIGIGHPGSREQVPGYVLHDFAKADQTWLEPLLEAIGDALPELVQGNDGRFMNQVSLAMPRLEQGEDAAKVPGNGKTKAKSTSKPKTPSQRDLARDAGERASSTAAQPEKSEGPLAGMLRRWLGGGKG